MVQLPNTIILKERKKYEQLNYIQSMVNIGLETSSLGDLNNLIINHNTCMIRCASHNIC